VNARICRHLLPFALVLCCLAPQAWGQGKELQRVQIGVGYLGSSYIGDLNNTEEVFHRFYPGVNFSLQLESKRAVHLQLNFGFSRFIAQNRNLVPINDIQPNTFTATRYFYGDLMVKIRFFRTKAVFPQVGVGVGFTTFNPKDVAGNDLTVQASTRAVGENYGTTAAMIPFSAGVMWRINEIASVGLDLNYQLVFSDYLDNIGQLGTRSGNDALYNLQASVYFTIPNKARSGKSQATPGLYD